MHTPFDVFVLPVGVDPGLQNAMGYALPHLDNQFQSQMVIRESSYLNGYSLEGRRELKALLQHEFFHVGQFMAIKDHNAYKNFISKPENLSWLMEASSTSIEHFSLYDPTKNVPNNEEQYKNFLVYGLGADFNESNIWMPITDDSIKYRQDIGYGMGLFFFYLNLQTKSPIIYNLWSQQIKSGVEPLKAIENIVASYANRSLADEWRKFCEIYFSGRMQRYGWPIMAPSQVVIFGNGNINFSKTFTMPKYSSLYAKLKNSGNKTAEFDINFSGAKKCLVLLIDESGTIIKVLSKNIKESVALPALKTYKLIFITSFEKESLSLSITGKEERLGLDCDTSICSCIMDESLYDPSNGFAGYWIDNTKCIYENSLRPFRLTTEMPYKNGKRHGMSKSFYYRSEDAGKIKSTIEWVNDVRNGEYVTYDKLGQITSCTIYTNGNKGGSCL
jgi:hypothetical protein